MAGVSLSNGQRGASYFMKLCRNYGWRTTSQENDPLHDRAQRAG